MLQFIDVYLQTREKLTLSAVHELEHRIFLIPEFANIHDDIQSKTNWMAYSRWIRFSLTTNSSQDVEKFLYFFKNIENFDLPEWTEEEKLRFEAEEKEWKIRQRQYFGSFATSLWEKKFDALNQISEKNLPKNLKNVFSWMRIYKDFRGAEGQKFSKNLWKFPIISEKIFWDKSGTMTAMILPIFAREYEYFIFFWEWVRWQIKENLQYTGKIYDTDSFNVYENEYILGVLHFYSPDFLKENFLKEMIINPPNERDFEYIRKILLFQLDEQIAFHDQEANVVMWFSPEDERKVIENTDFTWFLQKYPTFLDMISYVYQTHKI